MPEQIKRPPLLDQREFQFPYLYKFPGQESNEVILYATRESRKLLLARMAWLTACVTILTVLSGWMTWWMSRELNAAFNWPAISVALLIIIWLCGALIGYYICLTWRKTVGVLTNYRLVKIVQYGLFNHASQTLPLTEVVDTSVSNKKFWERLLGVATFTARSSASSSGLATADASEGRARINKKYFYWENIEYAEDLENYLHKLLQHQRDDKRDLKTFRPFIGSLKGERREAFMRDFPQYWS